MWKYFIIITINLIFTLSSHLCDEIFGCGGFVKSNFSINYARVDIKLYTKQGSLKYQTDCAPNNGYYLIPLYDKGDYVLKIEPPSGWSFEPTSVILHVDGATDPCSLNKDINFVFKGFTISGKILSYGQQEGPSNIKIVLKTSSGIVLQETLTDAGGVYSFLSVFPGKYIIEASHKTWKFIETTQKLSVEQDNVQAKNNIVVAGYDVTGHVFSEGEPIQNVHFLLFVHEKPNNIPLGCHKETVKGFHYENTKLHYLCHVMSSKDGSFLFPSLPTGKYKLITFHKGEHIEFDVSPPEVDFEVFQDSHKFEEHFQVEGFSVVGRILHVKGGSGVEGAVIYINDNRHTTTDNHGVYHLENMHAGVYTLKVEIANIYFDTVSMKITPNTPQLPEIFASKFSVCGHIQIENYPIGIPQLQHMHMKSLLNNYKIDIPVQRDGTFCTIAAPGSYVLEPSISDTAKTHGLQFDPPSHRIQLSHQPLLNLNFKQFLATVNGQIKCIEKCGQLQIKVISQTNDGFLLNTTTSEDGKFQLTGILPGRYMLTVDMDTWCFQSKKLDFLVKDKVVSDLVLRQSGFQVSVRLSHASQFKVKYPSGEMHNIQLEKAKNVLCLPESGIYEFIPLGCHLYKTDTFKLDTSKLSELDIQPSKHLITGNIFTKVNVSDIKVYIRKHVNASSEVIPLKEPVELKNRMYRYVFSVFSEPNTELEVKVQSSQLLFRPETASISVIDDCIDGAVEIIGKQGLFINGMVTPALEGVKMTIVEMKLKTILVEVTTDVKGQFTVGPLDDEVQYEVIAEKEGYFFTQQDGIGKFQVFKLAEIVAEVWSEDGAALPGVLLSLSGVDYRKNSLTQKNGKVSFIGLGPGQYFLRAMLKEYQFQPPTKIFDIKEGTQVNVKISGKRVAYSLYGVINSLTGEAEVGVAVEAVGIESETCRQYQEEAISEQGGFFRIRGLQPGCRYNLRLKKGSDINQHIERATPEETIVEVINGDIQNVRIIAFRHFGQMDVSGNVVSNQEYLQTLKVRLYCDDNPDQVLQTVTLGRSAFFFLPFMPIDQRTYILRLDTTLSSSAYFFENPSVTFKANTSFRHFTFTFQPKPKTQDHEVAQGSILALPFTVVIIILVYYYEKFLSLLVQAWDIISAVFSPPRTVSSDSSSADSLNLKKKVKARKT